MLQKLLPDGHTLFLLTQEGRQTSIETVFHAINGSVVGAPLATSPAIAL